MSVMIDMRFYRGKEKAGRGYFCSFPAVWQSTCICLPCDEAGKFVLYENLD